MIDKLFVMFCFVMIIIGFVLAFFCGDSLDVVITGGGMIGMSVIVLVLTR